jgi:hypothetical protein
LKTAAVPIAVYDAEGFRRGLSHSTYLPSPLVGELMYFLGLQSTGIDL